MQDGNYWKDVLAKRVSRRRAIAGAAMTAAGAGALYGSACGGNGDGGNGGGTGASKYRIVGGKTGERTDTTAQAQPGGTFVAAIVQEVPGFDGQKTTGSSMPGAMMAYYSMGLTSWKTGPDVAGGELIIVPEACESYEVLDGGSTIRFKLRPNVKFQNIPPVNGRVMDAEDWKFSFDRFIKVNNSRTLFQDVDHIEIDNQNNVLMKLKGPSAPLMTNITSYLGVVPKETDSGLNIDTTPCGPGPWMLEETKASIGVTWKKNPDYYLKDVPYFDKVNLPIVPEDAQRLVQFQGGNLSAVTPLPTSLLDTYNSTANSVMVQGSVIPYSWNGWFYGLEGGEDLPQKDVRVRQAMSMLFDRDLITSRVHDIDKLNEAELDVQMHWHSHISGGYLDYWLDPKTNQLGDVSKYFHRNVAEAKKLLDAAGYPNGFKMDLFYPTGPQYTAIWADMVNLTCDLLKDGGIQVTAKPAPELTEWRVKMWPTGGKPNKFTGMSIVAVPGTLLDPDWQLWNFHLQAPEGNSNTMNLNDEELNTIVRAQHKELDKAKRTDLIKQFQIKAAEKMYFVPWYGAANGYTLAQGYVKNIGVYQGNGPRAAVAHWWFDDENKRKS